LDRIVCFAPLKEDTLRQIAQKYLDQLQKRVTANGIQLTMPEESAAILAGKCKGKDGARQIRRIVEQEVECTLSDYLLCNSRKSAKVSGQWQGGTLNFHS
jgi:ATP-dependent Clp protease ATP-binding subunit ClpA